MSKRSQIHMPVSSEPYEEVRESIRRDLPNWTQPFFTWLTGKAYLGEEVRETSIVTFALVAILSIVGGIISGWFTVELAIRVSPLFLCLLPVTWVFEVHGWNVVRTVIMHAAAHNAALGGNLIGKEGRERRGRMNFFLGELITVVVVMPDFESWKYSHSIVHHSYRLLLTSGEIVYESLIKAFGLHAGLTKEQIWHKFLRRLFSPWTYIVILKDRLRQTFFARKAPRSSRERLVDPSTLPLNVRHNLLAGCFWFSIGCLMVWLCFHGFLLHIVLAYLIPRFVVTEAALMALTVVEHCKPDISLLEKEKLTKKDLYPFMTVSILFGDSTPDVRGRNFVDRAILWSVWWMRVIFYHYPMRMMVVAGDLTAHDWHHQVRADSPDWTNYVYARERFLAESPGVLRHIPGGLFAGMDYSFFTISQWPSDEVKV